MSRTLVSAALVLALGAPAHIAYAQASPHQRILLDTGWRFHLASSPVLRHAVSITDWRWRFDDDAPRDAASQTAPGLDTSGTDWNSARSGDDVFKGRVGFAWYRAMLPAVPAPGRTVRFDGVDDNAVVFLNGRSLATHRGWNKPFDVTLDSAWRNSGPNVLAVRVENTNGPGGITEAVLLGQAPPPIHLGNPTAPGFNDSGWRVVHLPHDYVVEQKFTPTADAGHGSLPTPMAWYRKRFLLSASARGKSVWIDFDGVYRDARVYLNGRLLGEHPSGYTSFRYDVSHIARPGSVNVLAVHVDPSEYEGWWYEGGGIYRHVWLNIANPLHIAPWSTFASSRLPEPQPGESTPFALEVVLTTIANAGAAAQGVLVSEVYDDTGAQVARGAAPFAAPSHGTVTRITRLPIHRPRLWSLEAPHLYRLEQRVVENGRSVDRNSTDFGIRTIRFDAASGFYLNGKRVEIQGACNHQDFAGVGIAVPDQLEYWRVKKLKEMGCNAWRMSHNPPTPALLDACDRLGMLVMDENRHLGGTYDDHTPGGTPVGDLSDLTSMILRDRNHPGIIMWSMCNEEGLEGSPEGAKLFAAMMKDVHRCDTTRPISCAMNGGWFEPGFRTVEDLMGVNYSPEVYARFHEQYPQMPLFASETASTVTTRGEYSDDRQHGWVSSYNMTDGSWEPVGSQKFVAGSFPWTGFDYKGEPTPYGWPDVNSNFGIMDMCGFPKDNYYYYRSWWQSSPVIHVMPHWNWPGREGQTIKVVVFSNCPEVELFLNDSSLGRKAMKRFEHLEWDVPYTPGALTARGYAAAQPSAGGGAVGGGTPLAEETVRTTGAPAALRLSADRNVLHADGEDLVPVEVDVVDAQGRVVPTAGNRVTFSVSGAGQIAGVGNGNPSDHDPDKADYRRAFNGKCLVIVGATERAGAIRLTAASPGLRPASLRLASRQTILHHSGTRSAHSANSSQLLAFAISSRSLMHSPTADPRWLALMTQPNYWPVRCGRAAIVRKSLPRENGAILGLTARSTRSSSGIACARSSKAVSTSMSRFLRAVVVDPATR